MKVKQLIRRLANIPADAEIIFVDNQSKQHKVDTTIGYCGGENAVMHLFEMEDIENENC